MSSAFDEPGEVPANASSATAALARRFAAGESEATHRVLQRVARMLAFRGYAIPAEDRRDLAQEVVTQVWQAATRPGFDVERGFWGFVEVVAARRCIDWVRTRKRSEPLDSAIRDERAGPLELVVAEEQARLASAVLARLPAACRDLVYLHAGLRKSYREIADLLDKTEGALRVQMFRCLKQAHTILAELTQARGRTPGAESAT